MEKNNEIMKSKKKFPFSLIICLAIVICALGAIGVKVLKVEDTNSGKETTKEIIVSDGDEIKVSDEETLRELLAKEETLSLVIKKDIYTSKSFAINGTKTLSGKGSIIMRLDAEAKKDLCVVSKGAELILDGATIDGNGVATGVHVQSGGKFKGLSGEISYGMPYGIQTAGVVEIEDITIDRAMHTALLVSTGGEAYMTGGKITNCIETGIAVAMKAYAKISGNAVLEGSAGSLAYNYGVLDITGGKLSGSTANTIFNKSELNIISESDKLVEICDSKGSAISAVGGTTVNIDGLYIHDVAKHGLNLEKEGTGVVKNCTIERLGRMGLYVATSSVMEIENVTIKECKYRGIVNNDGTVMVKNADISDMEGAGIITAGKKSVTTLEDIKIAKVAKSGLGITGGKVTAKNLNISDAAGSGINITTEASTSEITNAKVTKSGKNGIAMTIGTLTAKNIAIDGSKDNGVYLKAKAVANLTDTTIKNSEIHAVGNYGGKLTSKNLTIEVTEKGGIVSKGGTVNCDTTTISKTGSRAVNLLENCKGTMTKLTVKDAGNTGVYVDGGSFKLTDYDINGVARQGLYFLNSEKIVAQNGTISNAKTNGIYVGENANVTFENTSVAKTGEQGFAVYRGTVTVRDLTIEETGKGGLISDGGTIKGNTVEINKTKSRAISLKNNATANIKILEIAEAGSVGAWVEDSVGNFTDFTIDSAKGTGVSVEGTGNSYLKNGVINALAKGVFVNTGAKAEANNLKVYRMKGNAEPLIDVHTDAEFTLKDAESVVDGQGFTGRGMRVNGKVTMTGGTIKDNHFISEKKDGIGGGGVYIGATGNFIMNDGVIEKNTTSENGAGVYVRAGGNFAFNKGTVTNNKSDKAGAGIAVIGTLTMKNGKVEGNRTEGNAAGILVSPNAVFNMTGGTISGNAAGKSGGGLFVQSVNTTMSGGKIANNTASKNGAGVYVNTGATFKMDGEKAIVENNHSTKSGAGVAVYGTFNLTNGKIQNNTTTGNAAGVLVNKKGAFAMSGGTVSGNAAMGNGGGIYIQSESDDAEFTTNVHGGNITGNEAANGAGIYVDTNKNVSIKNVTVQSNTATENGGGVYVNRARSCVMSENSSIASNTAVNGGGVYIIESGTFKMENGSITANTATGTEVDGETKVGIGSGVYVGKPVSGTKLFEMTGGTISGHGTVEERSNSQGAGVYVAKDATFKMTGKNAVVENNYSSQVGAGVAVIGTFDMSNGTIQGNNTTGNGAGVLVSKNANFSMSGGNISSNITSKSGGGIFAQSAISITGGNISLNQATGTDGAGNGAGVYVHKNGKLDMQGGTVSSNIAADNGGGIYVESTSSDGNFTTNIYNGTITENSATNGAGVYINTNKKVSISSAAIQGNNATQNGGGIYSYMASAFDMESGTISGNSAVNGGGIYTEFKGIFTMKGGTITGNTATEKGSGAYIGATNKVFTLLNGSIEANGTSDSPSNSEGAGVYVAEDATLIMGSTDNADTRTPTIKNNYSNQKGAGVYVAGTFTMNKGTIQGNVAIDGGGVYQAESGSFTMNGGSIQGNNAKGTEDTYGKGGGVYAGATGTDMSFTMKGGTISGNGTEGNAINARGAGVYVAKNATFKMEQAEGKIASVQGNYSLQAGAGVAVDGTFTMNNGTIQGNNTTGNGAGILVTGNGTLNMNGGTVTGNIAGSNGGGIFTQSSNTSINSGNIIDNEANGTGNNGKGGGVYVAGSATLNLGSTDSKNNGNPLIQSNNAKNGAGVAVDGTFIINKGTIQSNEATANGAGVYVSTTGKLDMQGGTIQSNTTTGNGGGIYVESTSADRSFTTNIHNGMISENSAANGAGVYINTNKKVSMSGVTIKKNIATQNGGGIYSYSASAFDMESGTISSNRAVNGGGIYTEYKGIFTMNDGQIQSNIATEKGSGVYVGATQKTFTMKGGTISNHGESGAESTAMGAGVYVAPGATFEMNGANAVIKSNFSSQNGAGIYVDSQTSEDEEDGYLEGIFAMKNGKIQDNHTLQNGGGIYLNTSVDFTMTGGVIGVSENANEANIAEANGGAICAASSNILTLQGGKISGNTATGSVKGVFVTQSTDKSRVILYTDFVLENEIRYNHIAKSNRETDNPVLTIVGDSLNNTLYLGFHPNSSCTAYIQCMKEENGKLVANAELADQIFGDSSNNGQKDTAMIEQFKKLDGSYATSWKFYYEDGSNFIKVQK